MERRIGISVVEDDDAAPPVPEALRTASPTKATLSASESVSAPPPPASALASVSAAPVTETAIAPTPAPASAPAQAPSPAAAVAATQQGSEEGRTWNVGRDNGRPGVRLVSLLPQVSRSLFVRR